MKTLPIFTRDRNWLQKFLTIFLFIERILMEHIGIKVRSDSKLQISSICSIRIHSRKWDIFENVPASFVSMAVSARSKLAARKRGIERRRPLWGWHRLRQVSGWYTRFHKSAREPLRRILWLSVGPSMRYLMPPMFDFPL